MMIGDARSRRQIDTNLGSLSDRTDVMSRNEKEDNHGVKYMSRYQLHFPLSAVFKSGCVTTPGTNFILWLLGDSDKNFLCNLYIGLSYTF